MENWLAKIFGEAFPFGDVFEGDSPPRAGGSEKNKGELLKLKTTRDAKEGLADDFKQVNSKFSSTTSRFLELDQVFNA